MKRVALLLRLRYCKACTWAEVTVLLCTLTISCNPQLSSCSQKSGMNWVPSRQCCWWHKSQWLTWPFWALILFHPLPMLRKMKKNRVILSIHPLNLEAEFFPWSWIRIWSLFWFSRASELSKPVWVYSSVRWFYSIPGLAREKEERHFAASFFSPAETKQGEKGNSTSLIWYATNICPDQSRA